MSQPTEAAILGYVEPVDAKYQKTFLENVCASRIGGSPTFLKSVLELDDAVLICPQCSRKMSLLLQMFAPEDEDRPHAYVRIIYVFVCSGGRCSRPGWSPSFKVLRAQGTETGIRPIGSDFDRFPIFEIISEAEPILNAGTEKGAKLQGSLTNEIRDVMVENDGMEKYVKVKGDTTFYKFNKRLELAPEQILRYLRTSATLESSNAASLWISDKHKLADKDIPACEHCKSPRSIEFQIMPTLLSYLDLDDTKADSLDWGILCVYTCNDACSTANESFVEEKLYCQNYDMKTSIF